MNLLLHRSVENGCFNDINHQTITQNITEGCILAYTKWLQTSRARFMPAGCYPVITIIQLTHENTQWWQMTVCMMETHESNNQLVCPPDWCVSNKLTPGCANPPSELGLCTEPETRSIFIINSYCYNKNYTLFIVLTLQFTTSLLGGIKSMQTVLLYSVVKYIPWYL
jgi:hypothetical protein